MNCSTCGKCKSCGSGVVWSGLSPVGNGNAGAMNHVYHTISDMTSPLLPSVWVNAAVAAPVAAAPFTVTLPSGPCSDCGR